MIDTEKLGRAISLRRAIMGHTLDEVCEVLECTPPTFRKYLKGDIPTHKIKEVCDYAHVDVKEILKDE